MEEPALKWVPECYRIEDPSWESVRSKGTDAGSRGRGGALLENSEVTVPSASGLWSPSMFWPQIPFSISSYDVDDNDKNGVSSYVNGK